MIQKLDDYLLYRVNEVISLAVTKANRKLVLVSVTGSIYYHKITSKKVFVLDDHEVTRLNRLSLTISGYKANLFKLIPFAD